MVAYRLSANLLLAATVLNVTVPALIGLAFCGNKGRTSAGRAFARPNLPILIITVGVLLFAFLSSTVEMHPDSDDSLYVSNVALFSVSRTINPFDSSMGDVTTQTVPVYDFQTWESLNSVICRIFGFGAAETMHTLVVLPLLICSASALLLLGCALFDDNIDKAIAFVCIVSIIRLACRPIYYSEGAYLLRRIWQGKSVNRNIALPILSAATLTLFNADRRDANACMIVILMGVLAGSGLNPTTLYINGFELVFLSIAMALQTRRYPRWIRVAPGLIAILVFALMIYLRTRACPGMIENSSDIEEGFFLTDVRSYFQYKGIYIAMFVLALFHALFKGSATIRAYFIVASLLMLLCLWNPWSGRYVAEFITKRPTYHRVFWLLPVTFAISWAAVDYAFSFGSGKRLALLLLFMALACAGAGKQLLVDDYRYAQNVEKLPPAIIKIGSIIDGNPVRGPVLASKTPATELRQLYPDMELVVAKRYYADDVYTFFGRKEEGADRILLYDFVNGLLETFDPDGIIGLLKKYNVACIVIEERQEDEIALLEENGWSWTEEARGYRIYYQTR